MQSPLKLVGSNPNPKIEDLEYVIIPGKGFLDSDAKIHDQAYLYWKSFWSDVYAQAGSPESFCPDDFLRQDLITMLKRGDEVIALHLYSTFYINQIAPHDHRYFKFYPPSFFEFMRQKGANHVISFEFLTVDPGWRKSICGVSLAEVLASCGIHCMKALGADAAIAPARSDNKVNEMAYRIGFDCFQADVVKRNFKVDLIVCFSERGRSHPDSEIKRLADHFWENRKDLSGLTYSKPNAVKKTAA
jgi:hypothetical protein